MPGSLTRSPRKSNRHPTLPWSEALAFSAPGFQPISCRSPARFPVDGLYGSRLDPNAHELQARSPRAPYEEVYCARGPWRTASRSSSWDCSRIALWLRDCGPTSCAVVSGPSRTGFWRPSGTGACGAPSAGAMRHDSREAAQDRRAAQGQLRCPCSRDTLNSRAESRCERSRSISSTPVGPVVIGNDRDPGGYGPYVATSGPGGSSKFPTRSQVGVEVERRKTGAPRRNAVPCRLKPLECDLMRPAGNGDLIPPEPVRRLGYFETLGTPGIFRSILIPIAIAVAAPAHAAPREISGLANTHPDYLTIRDSPRGKHYRTLH